MARISKEGITRARNTKVGQVVCIVDTNFQLRIVFKNSFGIIIAVPECIEHPIHKHRIQLTPFTHVQIIAEAE